jgi:hypothetical protein
MKAYGGVDVQIHFEKRKFFTLPGLELRPLGRQARSQALYRLRYPGSLAAAAAVAKFPTAEH